ncbi:MAG: hypothetical protein AAB802_03360 [Patescibacteria group bacterium]
MIYRFLLAVLVLAVFGFSACESTPSFKATPPARSPIEEPILEETEPAGFSETEDGFDDFGACDEEAHTYCAGFYSDNWTEFAEENGYTTASWKYSLLDCLEDHRDESSQACDDSLDRREELNEAMNTACAEDRGIYCRGVVPIPGSEPQVDCLLENYEKLSIECTDALDAHEAAKPID